MTPIRAVREPDAAARFRALGLLPARALRQVHRLPQRGAHDGMRAPYVDRGTPT
jgi:hypothetical protein